MKLNPPASSSDLEVARAIARRLDQRARGNEARPDPTPVPPAPVAPPPRAEPTPAAARPPRKRVAEPPPSPPGPAEPASASQQELTDPGLELAGPGDEPEIPELDAPDLEPEVPELAAPELEPEPPELAAPEFEPEPPERETPDLPSQLEPDLPDLEPSFEPETPPAPPEPLFEPDVPELTDEPSPLPEESGAAYGADTGEFQPGEPGVSDMEEGVFEALPPGGYGPASGSFEAVSTEEPRFGGDEASDVEDALADLAGPLSEPPPELDALGPPESGLSAEDLLGEEPAPPSWSDPAALEAEMVGGEVEPQPEPEPPLEPPSPWDEVADSCLALAPANGAMLVDPAGQVLTARGDWPEPGPEAIAGRLVSMMEKKLRDAPTRSVSAPLAGQHLTAWRVPSTDGYLTVVFMADAPLKADVRPAIDTIVQAAGS